MNLKVLYIVALLSPVVVARAQVAQANNNDFVLFDPLFWKDKLKLDDTQCQKIKQINSEYYEKLYAAVRESNNNQAVRAKAAQTLIERSEEIWETFHPKQRKRWKKISQDTVSHNI